jgi:hypothetical protein
MDLLDLKKRTIHGVYHTLPLGFQQKLPWEEMKDDFKCDDTEIFSSLCRMEEHSSNATEKMKMEYVASVADCTCKLDLIQLTSIHMLSTSI